jgi:hypothetical protein
MILMIALLTIVPFGLAWYYAKHPQLITRHSNYGTLILPPRTVDYAELLARPITAPETLPDLKGRWVLLQVAPAPCGAVCAETLHKTRQSRLMLNKEIARVRRLLLVPEGPGAVDPGALLKEDETLLVAGASPALLQKLADALGKPPAEGMVLLMDPLANVILWYEIGFDPYGLVKDLKHLLRASQIG